MIDKYNVQEAAEAGTYRKCQYSRNEYYDSQDKFSTYTLQQWSWSYI